MAARASQKHRKVSLPRPVPEAKAIAPLTTPARAPILTWQRQGKSGAYQVVSTTPVPGTDEVDVLIRFETKVPLPPHVLHYAEVFKDDPWHLGVYPEHIHDMDFLVVDAGDPYFDGDAL